MAESSTPARSTRDVRHASGARTDTRALSVRSGRALSGWVGAWLALAVLPGWYLGAGVARVSPLDWTGSAAPACVLTGCLGLSWIVLFVLELRRSRAQPEGTHPRGIRPDQPRLNGALPHGIGSDQTRPDRSRPSRIRPARTGLAPASAVFALWALVGLLSGVRSTPAAQWRAAALPSVSDGWFIVRIDQPGRGSDPRWVGRLWAVCDDRGWRVGLGGAPVEGWWTGGCGDYLVGGSLLGSAEISKDPGEDPAIPRISIHRAFRLSPPRASRPSLRDRLEPAQDRFSTRLVSVLGPDAGTLAAWVLLGPRRDVPRSWSEPFRRTGTAHLLAIAGFHMTLIGGILYLALRIVTRGAPWCRWPALFALGFYCFEVGTPVPALRAYLGAILLALAPKWGRAPRVWDALGWTGTLLPVLDPSMPKTASFSLSMSAMTGVFLGRELGSLAVRRLGIRRHRAPSAPRARGRFPRLGRRLAPVVHRLRKAGCEVLGVSAGASLMIFPWCLHHFGVIYPLGLFINAAALPLMAVVMTSLLIAAIAVALGAGPQHPLAAAGRGAAAGFFALIRTASEWSGRCPWPGRIGRTDALAATLAAGGALWLAVLVLRRQRRSRLEPVDGPASQAERSSPGGPRNPAEPSSRGASPDSEGSSSRGDLRRPAARNWRPPGHLPALAWTGLFSLPLVLGTVRGCIEERPFRAAPLEARFLDVGQGDAILLRAGRTRWLVDLGPGSRMGRDRLVPQLQQARVTRLDRVWITHQDLDHRGGLPDLLASSVRVDTLVLPSGACFPDSFWIDLSVSPQRPVLLRAAAPWARRISPLVDARLLHPPAGFRPRKPNDSCFSLLFNAPRFRLLLVGDLEKDREAEVLRRIGAAGIGPVTAAQLGHHGSRTAGSDAWWRATRPFIALISVGAGNHFGLPNAETLESARRWGARVLRTDRMGWIRIAGGEGGLFISRDRP